MKAAIYTRYGPPEVVQVADIEKPVPKDDEVLIQVRAASLNPADWHFARGTPYAGRFAMGLRRPKVNRLGLDLAGVVESVGKRVTEFKAGDEVFGSARGAFAENACAFERSLTTKPENVTFEEAAGVRVAAMTALQALRDRGKVQPGQKVLINGAAGGVGTFAVQIAKWLGAEVTGVCSARNVAMVKSLGAARVVDYTKEDFTRSAQRFDVLLDDVGNRKLSECRRVLTAKGKYILIGGGGPDDQGLLLGPGLVRAITAPLLSRFVSQEMSFYLTKMSKEDLTTIRGLIETGKVKPVIDRRYKLSEVSEALRYLETGHARGKVVITL